VTAIESQLQFLYGKTVAPGVYSELRSLMDRHRISGQTTPVSRKRLPLPEKDALLITYGDQVREDAAAPLKTLADFSTAHLQEAVSGIHILPFYPWSSDDGFSVKDFFSVDPALGNWDHLTELDKHFDLMFDAVFNHMSAGSEWFQGFLKSDPKYRDFFVTIEGDPDLSQVVRPRALPLLTEFATTNSPKKVWTTFSADQVDLNFQNPKVLVAVLDALLSYVRRGARFIRLDAIAYLWKEIGTTCIHLPQTHGVIQLMRSVLDVVAPGVMLITETNVPHLDNISYFGNGADEAQLVYNFALPPLVLHSLASGNAQKLTGWAQTLMLPSDQVTFFNFLASHDGIGLNPARGILSQAEIDALVSRTLAHGGFVSEKHNSDGSRSPYEMNITYFDALSNPSANEPIDLQIKRFLVAHAIMFSLQGVPGIYFHSLFGSRNDRAAAISSGIPRRINRQKLLRAELEQELANADSLRGRVFSGLKELLRQRRSKPAFSPLASQEVLHLDPRVFAVRRENRAAHDCVLCLHNVSAGKVELGAAEKLGQSIVLSPYEVKWIPA
jgi:sucrose phosphorylase